MNRTYFSVLLLIALPSCSCRTRTDGKDGQPESGAPPSITISKETTFITCPLDKDGNLDFVAALNERRGKSVTAENNACVLIWKALGPNADGKKMPPEFFQMLGMDEPPEKGDYFVDWLRYLLEIHKDPDPSKTERELEAVDAEPWTEKQYPVAAAWLKANQKPLDLLVEAAKRSRFYSPAMPYKDQPGSGTIDVLPPTTTGVRALTIALITRALLHLGEERYMDAWRDLLTARRLGRHVARGGTLIDKLVGAATEMRVSRAILVFIERAKIDAKTRLSCLTDCQALPAVEDAASAFEFSERLYILDQVIAASRHPSLHLKLQLTFAPNDKLDPKATALFDKVDWDAVLRHTNKSIDDVMALLRKPERDVRDKLLNDLVEEQTKRKKDLSKADALKQFLKETDAAGLQKLLTEIYVSIADSTRKVHVATELAEQTQRNVQVAFALSAYNLDHRRYPANLEELAPKYLAKVPNDLFTGKPLVYRPTDNGYLFYSFGTNGKDEAGRWMDDDPPGDDLNVRMPIPERKPMK